MNKQTITRRKFLGTAATAAAFTALPLISSCSSGSGRKKPNSKVAGVQLGCTTYSYRSMPHKVDDVIDYLILAGINSIELRHVAEEDLGIPVMPQGPRVQEMTDELRAEFSRQMEEVREAQRQWRLSLPMSRYEEMRKKFNKAGIDVHISKFAPSAWSDEEIDYAYKAAKTLGSIGITDEYSDTAIFRLGKFAEKHNSLAMYHTHEQPAAPEFSFDSIFAASPANYLNLDAGHYYGATGLHPNEVIIKYHDRMRSIHIKDKTGPDSTPAGVNMPFGEGETPIADILLLLKKEKWPIQVDIELEYKIPDNSDAAREVAKCIEYMRNILE
ncbi:MAG: sugar phosphate isomerase/epimerase [Bacteroidales bacterium]|nr:sugar phosphate isomerase/epimerase [Bacteroidales bacterium]